jgi:ADP-heptose:LPS heptosyltransferase
MRVLVARLDNAGDVLLAGPAIRAVAASAEVVLLCGPHGAAAGELLPGVARTLTWTAPWVGDDAPALDPADVGRLVDTLAALDLDQAFVLTSFHQSPLPMALLLRLAGVPTIAATSVDFPGTLLDVRHPVLDDAHEVEQSLSLVATLGHHLPAGDDGRLALRGPLPDARPFDQPYVVVHPGASVPTRGYPADRAARVVELLVASGWRVAVTGGPAEREATAAVAGRCRPEVVDLGGRTGLVELAGILAGAAVLVSGNTGPAHLAAAVGTPVAEVFAPVVAPHRWRPWGVPSVLLGDLGIGCAGCRARTCPFPGQPCLDPVTPEAVVDAVATLAGQPAGMARMAR